MKALRAIKKLLLGIRHSIICRQLKRQESIRQFMEEYIANHRQPYQDLVNGHFGKNRHYCKIAGGYRHFIHYHRSLKYIRPLIFLFTLALWYIIIRHLGAGTLGIFMAILFSLAGIYQIFFLWRLEEQVLNPIDQLKLRVDQITKGNYQVQVECNVFNDLTLLVASFNDMAKKLRENEQLKAEYEANRKTLIANISHDLKTPITSIQGYIEALKERTDLSVADTHKYLQIIYHNTTYMNRLIDDLFLFSKLDLEKLEFQWEILPVRGFMQDVMEEFRLELEDKQIRFEYTDGLSADCTVRIDRKRFYQALRNIIGNAVKYGRDQDLAIYTVLKKEENKLKLEFHDNGPGIEEDKLPFIFERFFRVDPERTKDLISTGLGLAIAKELVTAHGGTITVSSTVGEGSCFIIKLPILLNHAEGGDRIETDLNY